MSVLRERAFWMSLGWALSLGMESAAWAGGPGLSAERVASRGGLALDVEENSGIVFLLEGGALAAIDASALPNVGVAGEITLPTAFARSLVVEGPYAFAGSSGESVVAIDVRVPGEMRVIGVVDHGGAANEMVSEGQHLYVADGAFPALRIFDISDPAAPAAVGELSTEFLGAASVRVVGSVAYLADSANSTLATVDVSDPTSPVLLAWLESPRGDWFDDLDVRLPYAYLAGAYLLQVVDVTDPSRPVVLAEVGNEAYATSVAVRGDYAFVGAGTDGVAVLDIGDAANPTLVNVIDTPYWVVDVFATDDYLYVSDGDALEIFSLSLPSAPERIARLQRIGDARRLSHRQSTALVSSQFTGHVHLVDLADPVVPLLLGSVALQDPHELLGVGDFLYVADGFWGLRTISIADPTDPRLGDTLRLGSGVFAGVLEQIDAYLYVGSVAGARKIFTISLADPARPEVVGETATSENVRDLAIANEYLFAAEENGLEIFDIADRAAPTLVQQVASGDSVLTVEVRWPYVFLAVNNFGLRVLDVSDIDNPVVAGEYPADNYPSVVRLGGPFAFLGALGRMEVLSISDPTAPRWLATIEQVNNPSDARFVDGRLVLADGRVDVYRLDTGGDLDADGDVDVADFATFSACFSGSGVPCEGDCCLADFSGDGSVDIADFATFAANFTGSR